MDVGRGLPFLKRAAEESHPAAQYTMATLLWDGKWVAKDVGAAVRYCRLAADRGVAEAQYRYAMLNLTGEIDDWNARAALHYLKSSAENGSEDGQFLVACMVENGIDAFPSIDLDTALRYYERCADRLPTGSAAFGFCLSIGRGVPIDFTVAAEFFKKAADADEQDGLNCFGCCLERGEGVDADIHRAVYYYQRAASLSHPDGMYNYGRCLEYGKGVDRDLQRAAKYYRLAAAKQNAAAQNSFGICLERGIGVHKNLTLAAHFYRRAADYGHADGANNLGFCLEHGRGVEQNIEVAAEYYQFAADRGHPEAKLNRARCNRLLGQWEPPDRSSESVSHPPSRDRLLELFHKFLDNPGYYEDDCQRLASSLHRLKTSTTLRSPASSAVVLMSDATWSGYSFNVRFLFDSNSEMIVVKGPKSLDGVELIQREKAILEGLCHPLILKLRHDPPHSRNRYASIVTEYAGNGALFSQSSWTNRVYEFHLRGANRIARIVVGIALAMRFAHSRGLIHSNLMPDHILLDWDWNVRISSFSHSFSYEYPLNPDRSIPGPQNIRYLAPECYDGDFLPASDVFSFGMILYEILTDTPAFASFLRIQQIAFRIVIDDWRPEIPDFILPPAAALISDCWASDPDDRPTFAEVVDRLKEMEFKVIPNVNSGKLSEFVRQIEEEERYAED